MLNSAPKQSSKYKQGLFTPKNKDKVIKLNSAGGVYYRSGLELRMMIYLDNNPNILRWSSELIKIPYEKNEWDKHGDMYKSTHNYYPDFYYELKKSDNSVSKVVAEVKSSSEASEPVLKQSKPTAKQLKNFEYSLKMWNKNLSKWKYMIEWCNRKGFEFIIITEKHLGS